MSFRVPLFATAAALRSTNQEVVERVGAVLESGRFILGEEVAAFEDEFARYIGVRHGVGVNSGTDALSIGLRALGVGAGSEVIVPAVSFAATAEAVVHAGATPVFADVEPGTWCMSARTVEPALGERTAAIVPVHLFGNPAPMGELIELARDRGLLLLEDAAQAAGARLDGRMAGSIGDAAAFSFYPGKNLGGIGDGGALLTDDDEVAASARRLRDHGSEDRVIHTVVGFNSRLDAIQAAALRVRLRRLADWTAARRAAAASYAERGLGDLVGLPEETAGVQSCWHLYVVATPRREDLQLGLERAGIESRVYYTPTLDRQPAFEQFAPSRQLPGAERYARECLAIPIGPDLGAAEVDAVIEAVRAALT